VLIKSIKYFCFQIIEKSDFVIKMNKAVILVVLPCLIALVSCAYYQQQYAHPTYTQSYGYGGQRNVAPYANYGANSYQAVKQARLFNYRKSYSCRL